MTNKGSDVVFEPQIDIENSFTTRHGTTTLDAQGQGFIFTDHSRYAHGTLRLQAMHAFSPETRVRLRYYYAPNLFLGDNEERRSGMQRLVDETVTSHIWSARGERELRPGLEVRGATTKISQGGIPTSGTVGPHVNWRIFPRVKLGLSYHYERGLAEGRHQP